MKLAIRDDDTCYFTDPSELERVYHDVWDRIPVCLATVPFAVGYERAGIPREVLIRNQFGGSLGGPIRKNRGFFFFNWQSQRMQQSLTQTRTVLTPTARQGIFRYMVGAANAASFVNASGQPTVPACGGSVSTNCYMSYDMAANDPLGKGLDKLMQSQVKLTDLPNDYSGGDGFNTANFRFNAPASAPQDNYTTKIDWRFNSATQASFLAPLALASWALR